MAEVHGHIFVNVDETVEVLLGGLEPQATELHSDWQPYSLAYNYTDINKLRHWTNCRRRVDSFNDLPKDVETITELLEKLRLAFDDGPEQRINRRWRLMGIVVDTALHNTVEVVIKYR